MVLIIAGFIESTGWFFLVRTYSIISHINDPAFAFDKIEGHFHSAVIQKTYLVFLVLCFTALYRIAWIKKRRTISSFQLLLLFLPILVGVVSAFFMYPVGGLDLFPYILRSKLMVVYRANPYIQVPLRVSPEDPFFAYDHFPHHTLGYGPVWALLARSTFYLSSLIFNPDDLLPHVFAFKAQSLLFLIGTTGVLGKYQTTRKAKIASMAFFMGNPLVLFEVLANGHNDGMMTFFLISAVLLLLKGRWESLPVFMASVLVKPFPLVLLPLLAVHALTKTTISLRKWILSVILTMILFVSLWAPFLDSPRVLPGITSGLFNANRLKTGSINSILREILILLNAPGSLVTAQFIACVILTLGLSILLIIRHLQGTPLLRAAGITFLLFCALLTNMLPWYLIFYIAVSALSSSWEDLAPAMALTCLGLVFYLISIWAWFDSGSTSLVVHIIQSFTLTIPALLYSLITLHNSSPNSQPYRATLSGF